MKMHINNILNQYHATADERIKVAEYFKDNTISHASVAGFLEEIRK
jgi:hydroxymethylglutaryl-CoA reductase